MIESAGKSKRLGEIEVTPREYAGEYTDGERFYDRHLDLIDVFGDSPDTSMLSATAYPLALGFTRRGTPEGYNAALSAAKAWLGGKTTPSIQGLTRLHLSGIFPGLSGYKFDPDEGGRFDPRRIEPLTYKSDMFELLALVSSFLYWSGSLRKNRSTTPDRRTPHTSKLATLSSRDLPHALSFLGKIKELGWCVNEDYEQTEGWADQIYLDAYVARVIHHLTAHIGRKNTMGDSFLSVVDAAIRTLEETMPESSESDERFVAYQVLRDFVLAFLSVRLNPENESLHHKGMLVCNASEEIRDAQRDKFLRILGMAGFGYLQPKATPFTNPVSVNRGPSTFSTTLRFPDFEEHHLHRIRLEFAGRVEEVLGKARRAIEC